MPSHFCGFPASFATPTNRASHRFEQTLSSVKHKLPSATPRISAICRTTAPPKTKVRLCQESSVIVLEAPTLDENKIISTAYGITHGESTVRMQFLPMEKSYFDGGPPWTRSALTAQVGFPLEALVSPVQIKKNNSINFGVNNLFAVVDPASPRFLSNLIEFRDDVVLVRTDGKPIHPTQIEALAEYLGDMRNKWLRKARNMKDGEEKEVAKQRCMDKLTPEAFHAFFKNYRRQQVRDGRTPGSVKAVSPVTITLGEVAPACGACYAKAEPGKHLLTCAKCKTRYYCGRACQKEDWKEHKKVCGMD